MQQNNSGTILFSILPKIFRRFILAMFFLYVSANGFTQSVNPNIPTGRVGESIPLLLDKQGQTPMIPRYNMQYGGGSITEDKITGNPYNADSFQFALLQGNGPADKWFGRVKIHEVSGEVYFLNNKNEVRALDKGFINKIIFYKNGDTSQADKTYISNISFLDANNEYGNPFMQMMNKGQYVLLKRTIKDVHSADSLFGTQKRYYFATSVKYYISNGPKIFAVKKLSRENITNYIPRLDACKEWVEKNNINFKKEEDIIIFLNYYNSLQVQ